MTEDFKHHLIEKHQRCKACPSNEAIKTLFEEIMALLFPDFSNLRLTDLKLINNSIDKVKHGLEELFVHHPSICSSDSAIVADKFMALLQKIEETIQMDVDAIYEGDPAAKSREEVIRSYPGFYAIAAYRIAHQLHQLGIQIIPRIITEIAHHRTGIDIHPAAQIDHSFCIDHGTGVVIGETTIIGKHVKIYQGVTLGALSVNKVDANSKRHPTIEAHVVIYSNATILGGDTKIGHHSIIGGNVWITKSIDPHSTIYYVAGDNQIEKHK